MIHIPKTPSFIRKIFPRYTWNIPGANRMLYLTFDDGPVPEATEFALNTLAQYRVKATFFCLGNNVAKHPDIYQRIIQDGHRTGNHTWNHVNGWQCNTRDYLEEIEKTAALVQSDLFRPPYGKIRRHQANKIMETRKIIMWDVLSYDFDVDTSREKCLDYVISNARPGSIIIFHDSYKAFKNMQYALPRSLEYLLEKGFEFSVIT